MIRAWIKLPDLEGKRTIASRVGATLGASGLAEQVNFHFFLQGGAPVLRFEDAVGAKSYEVALSATSADEKLLARDLLAPRKWVQVAVAVALNWSTDVWRDADAYVFFNGLILRSVRATNTGSMKPSDVPDITSRAWAMVYGQDEQDPAAALYPVAMRWGLGGKMSQLEILSSDTAFIPYVPTAVAPLEPPDTGTEEDDAAAAIGGAGATT